MSRSLWDTSRVVREMVLLLSMMVVISVMSVVMSVMSGGDEEGFVELGGWVVFEYRIQPLDRLYLIVVQIQPYDSAWPERGGEFVPGEEEATQG